MRPAINENRRRNMPKSNQIKRLRKKKRNKLNKAEFNSALVEFVQNDAIVRIVFLFRCFLFAKGAEGMRRDCVFAVVKHWPLA